MLASVLELLIGGAACFDPKPGEGLVCSATGACPSGQECIENSCYRAGNEPTPDAAIDVPRLQCTVETLASGQDSGTDLDVSDATYVYWTSNTGTLVLRAPKLRGPLEVFHDSGVGRHPYAVAVDATHVYWSENDAAGRIMRKALASVPTDLAEELASGQGEPVQLAVDVTHVYWSNLATGTVNRIAKAGGSPELLASSQGAPNHLRLDSDSVFWLNTGGGQVMRSGKGGPPLQQLASDQNQPSDLAVFGGSVVWTDRGDGALRSVAKGGGPTQTIVSDQAEPTSLAITDEHILWSNQGSGELLSELRPALAPVPIADTQAGALSLAIDGMHVYWLNSLDSANRLVRATCAGL